VDVDVEAMWNHCHTERETVKLKIVLQSAAPKPNRTEPQVAE